MKPDAATTRVVPPSWLYAWSDYPHRSLDQERARELLGYAVKLEDRLRDTVNAHDAAVALAEAIEAATITTAIEFAHPEIVALARKVLAGGADGK